VAFINREFEAVRGSCRDVFRQCGTLLATSGYSVRKQGIEVTVFQRQILRVMSVIKGKGKGKVHPITGHEGPDLE